MVTRRQYRIVRQGRAWGRKVEGYYTTAAHALRALRSTAHWLPAHDEGRHVERRGAGGWTTLDGRELEAEVQR